MSKLTRPHIPLDVRCRVAMRQLTIGDVDTLLKINRARHGGLRAYLNDLLARLANQFGVTVKQLHLDHDPALENRHKVYIKVSGTFGLGTFYDYDPQANDPDHLIYREGGFRGSDHDVKTRVRGEHGQLSDHGLARKEKRRQRKLTGKKRKHKWAKGRKLQSRNTLSKRSPR